MPYTDALETLAAWPRTPLVREPTPLIPAPNLSRDLGLERPLWMKMDGETGFVLRRNTPDEVADRVGELFEDPSRRGRMGEAARRRMQEAFSWEHAADRFLELFDEILGSYPGEVNP